jgi:hypothetical protein
MVTINIAVESDINCWMNTGRKIVPGKNGPKGSVLKMTVTLLLRSISDLAMEATTAIGADVNSFIGRGNSLQTRGVADLWRKRSGYHERGGGVVMVWITGYFSYPLSMRV